jgi:hypothetical protein
MKLIGEVIQLTGTHPGYVVRVTRYPSGRKLPAPRLLMDVDTGQPYATAFQALEALNTYRRDIRSVRPLKPGTALHGPSEAPQQAIPRIHRIEPNHALDHDEVIRRRKRREKDQARRVNPTVTKAFAAVPSQNVKNRRDKTDLEVEMLIASGNLTITKLPAGARQWDSKW